MTETLILPRHKLTVADYYRLGAAGVLAENDRVELIDGELMDMAPIGTFHADYVDRLMHQLVSQSRNIYRVRIQNPVRLGDNSEPEPDIAIVKNQSYRDAHPTAAETLLLIEVADSTLVYDQMVKTPLYARHGIPETWVLDVAGQRMECYRQPGPEGYQERQIFSGNAVLRPLRLPQVRVELATLWN